MVSRKEIFKISMICLNCTDPKPHKGITASTIPLGILPYPTLHISIAQTGQIESHKATNKLKTPIGNENGHAGSPLF